MFQSGDVVQLKSGGPAMTVRWCQQDSGSLTAYCDWFEEKTKQGAAFAAAQLRKVDGDALTDLIS